MRGCAVFNDNAGDDASQHARLGGKVKLGDYMAHLSAERLNGHFRSQRTSRGLEVGQLLLVGADALGRGRRQLLERLQLQRALRVGHRVAALLLLGLGQETLQLGAFAGRGIVLGQLGQVVFHGSADVRRLGQVVAHRGRDGAVQGLGVDSRPPAFARQGMLVNALGAAVVVVAARAAVARSFEPARAVDKPRQQIAVRAWPARRLVLVAREDAPHPLEQLRVDHLGNGEGYPLLAGPDLAAVLLDAPVFAGPAGMPADDRLGFVVMRDARGIGVRAQQARDGSHRPAWLVAEAGLDPHVIEAALDFPEADALASDPLEHEPDHAGFFVMDNVLALLMAVVATGRRPAQDAVAVEGLAIDDSAGFGAALLGDAEAVGDLGAFPFGEKALDPLQESVLLGGDLAVMERHEADAALFQFLDDDLLVREFAGDASPIVGVEHLEAALGTGAARLVEARPGQEGACPAIVDEDVFGGQGDAIGLGAVLHLGDLHLGGFLVLLACGADAHIGGGHAQVRGQRRANRCRGARSSKGAHGFMMRFAPSEREGALSTGALRRRRRADSISWS